MTIRLEKFTGAKTYMFPNGELATPEAIRKKWPAVDVFPHILEINGNVIQAVGELQAMLNLAKIDKNGQSEDEQIAALEAATIAARAPRTDDMPPSPEVRIANALEKIADFMGKNAS
jgi:hypothetical protein